MRPHLTFAGVVSVMCFTLVPSAFAQSQICTPSALTSALAGAPSGATVQIGRCTITGSFSVPAGVTLRGRAGSIIQATAGQVAVTLNAGSQVTTLTDVRVQSDGRAAVVVNGPGAASITHVRIDVTRGIGIGADHTGILVIDDVRVRGPVSDATATTTPMDGDPGVVATYGIALLQVADASMFDVEVNGFSTMGIFAFKSNTTVVGLRSRENVGSNFMAWGGTADIEDARLAHLYRGDRPSNMIPATLAAVDAAVVHATNIDVVQNDGRGILLDTTAQVELDDARVAHNSYTGVWLQNAGYLQVDNSQVIDNGFGGLVAVDSGLVSISGSRFARTDLTTSPANVSSGDGIQLIRTPASLMDVTLSGNDRAGLLADLGSSLAAGDLQFLNVSVRGRAGSLGLVTQRDGVPQPLVTDGVQRQGQVASADPAWTAQLVGLTLAGAVNPCLIPIGTRVVDGGMAYLLGLSQNPPPQNPPPGP